MAGRLLLLVSVGFSALAGAQQPAAVMVAESDLPEAAAPAQATAPAQAIEAAGTGVISGTVLDVNSAIVPGASVRLETLPAGEEQTAIAGSDGRFSFAALPAGRFQLTISAPGLATFVSTEIVLHAGEHAEQPRIALPVALATTEVSVVVTEQQLATEQVHAEEKQRAFGVLPNFYSSYIWDAAPLSARQKLALAVRAAIDPTVFLGAAVGAAVGQAVNTYGQYGQGAQGYAKRFGAAYGDAAIGTMIGQGALPALLHQDPRYFYRGSGTIRERIEYAATRGIICRNDKGRDEFNYSNVLGNLAAGGLSNLYYPSHDRGISLTFTNWAIGTAGDAAQGLVREFILRKITPGVPDYAQGKP
jgi:hypothetical protein